MLPAIRWLAAVGVAVAGFSSLAATPPPAALVQPTPIPISLEPGAAPLPAPAADPATGLVGQTVALCDRQDVVFAATVERADWLPQADGRPRVILVMQVANSGDGSTHSYLGGRLTDERGRLFDMVSASATDLDQAALARRYGAQSLSWDSIQSERSPRHVWVFTVAADVQALRIAQDPLNRC
jgi:hypothetical protein